MHCNNILFSWFLELIYSKFENHLQIKAKQCKGIAKNELCAKNVRNKTLIPLACLQNGHCPCVLQKEMSGYCSYIYVMSTRLNLSIQRVNKTYLTDTILCPCQRLPAFSVLVSSSATKLYLETHLSVTRMSHNFPENYSRFWEKCGRCNYIL